MADPNTPIPTTLWSAHSTSIPPPDLRDVLSQLGHTLSQLNYTKTLAALLKEAEKKGDAAPQAEEWGKSIEVDRAVGLLAMWEVWREKNNGKLPTLRINAAKQKRKEKEVREKEEGKSTLVPAPHAEESSSEESSGSESDEDEEMVDEVAAESGSDDSSSEASSSEEDSSDDEEEVGDAKVGAKRKRVLTPESESESSSSEDSSTSSSESEDDAPPAKRAKTVETKSDSSSDSASSDSDSDEEAGVAVPPTTPAAKTKAAPSASSSSSSSSEDSSSSSSSESEAPPPPPPSTKKAKKAKKTKAPAAPPPKDSSDAASAASSTTLPNSPTKPSATPKTLDHDELLVSVPALNALDANLNPPSETGGVMHPDRLKRLHPNDDGGSGGKSFVRMPATEENVKKMKKGNVPFSRVPKDTVVDEKFKSNEYVSYEYADRAYQDLSVTKGKGFTKEKNKKKRGKPLSAQYMRLFSDIRDFHRILEYGPDGMDELGKDWFTIRGDGYDNWWDSDDWTTDTGDEGKESSSALPSLSAEDRETARKARRRRRKAKARRAKERTKRLVLRKQRQLQRLRALREASVIMPREARKLGLWSAPKQPEKNPAPFQESKAPKRQYTRENPHKGEPKGSVPDHELTRDEIQEKREWVQQGRYDRSLSPVQYTDEEAEPIYSGYNPHGLKSDTFDFMAGCGFNPMSGRWR
ncbi:jun-like transcription factor [Elasticomyces elasticus]|nr:jun-like transcription factor [Elasticomyces elasticus]KAK4972153.1 jun-like transcription factor [Elasticomyces elasticus]